MFDAVSEGVLCWLCPWEFSSSSINILINFTYNVWSQLNTRWPSAMMVLNRWQKDWLVNAFYDNFMYICENYLIRIIKKLFYNNTGCTYLLRTASLGDFSCGSNASRRFGWNWISKPPNRERRSPSISKASSWTETSFCCAMAAESLPTMVLHTMKKILI